MPPMLAIPVHGGLSRGLNAPHRVPLGTLVAGKCSLFFVRDYLFRQVKQVTSNGSLAKEVRDCNYKRAISQCK